MQYAIVSLMDGQKNGGRPQAKKNTLLTSSVAGKYRIFFSNALPPESETLDALNAPFSARGQCGFGPGKWACVVAPPCTNETREEGHTLVEGDKTTPKKTE